MGNPQISVIVPVYNAENYIQRCIDSVLSQSFSEFELILVNDGSKDASLDICKANIQKDSRVRVLNKQRGGVSSARNLGIEEARGEWTVFIDADDWIDADYLETLLRAGESHDMVISGFQYVLQRDGKLVYSDVITPSLSVVLSYDELFCLPHLMTTPWCKLFKTSIIREHCLRFDEKMRMGEDTCFVCSYLCHTKNVCFSEYAGYKYLYGTVVGLGVKYKMSTSDFVYHFTHIVDSMQSVSRSLGITMDNSIENEKKIFFHLYIEILKHLGFHELIEYRKQYGLMGVSKYEPKALEYRKKVLLKLATTSPLVFYVVARLFKI